MITVCKVMYGDESFGVRLYRIVIKWDEDCKSETDRQQAVNLLLAKKLLDLNACCM